MKIKLIFAWYDIWIGAFWDQKKKWLYIFPVPMLGVIIKFNKSCPHADLEEVFVNYPDAYIHYKCRDCGEEIYKDL